MSRTVLYEFPHSHFCEVARWGLDYKGIDYERVALLPGLHAPRMRRLAGATSVPVLRDAGTVVQGASAILDYLERSYPQPSLRPPVDADALSTFEADVARDIGVPLRSLCYYHLLAHPALVRYFFMHRSSRPERAIFALAYPLLRQRIRTTYDCNADGAHRAEQQLTTALARYDQQLGAGDYFYAGHFSRADLSFAALLVFMVMPAQYPVAWPAELAGMALTRWFEGFASTPSYRHVARMYARHRLP